MSRRSLLDPTKPWMPMRARLVLFALLCALPVFLLTGLQFRRDSQRFRGDAIAAVQGTAERLERRLAHDLVSAETVGRAIGAVDLKQPGAVEACSVALRRAVQAAGPRITNYILVSPGGDVVCSGQPIRGAINLGDRPYVQQALRTKRPVLSGFTVGRVTGRDNLQLVVPVLDADDRVTALALAGLSAATLASELPVDGKLLLTLELFDQAGVLVSRSPDSTDLSRGQAFAQSELFGGRVAMTRGMTELRGLDGIPRLYASRALQFHGETVLWIVSGAEIRTLEAVTRLAMWRDMGIVLLLALAVGGVAVAATRPMVLKPRELELSHAKRLARLGSWFLDTRSGSVEWSEEAFALFGRDPEPGASTRSDRTALLTAESLAAMEAANRNVLANGQPYEIELEGIRPDQTRNWVLARGEAVRDTSLGVAGVRGTVFDITEHKRAEQAVQRSQRQLRHVMDGLGPSIFVALLTPEGILVEVNRSPLAAAGLQAQDVLGMPFADTPWWRDSPHAQQQLRDAIARAARGEPSQYEVRTHGTNDEVYDLDFSLQPLRDETGKVIFLISSASVITERKRVETALRASESEFRALAESMPQIVWMTRPDGWNIYVNQRWADYTGLTAAESSGHGWNVPFHPEDQQRAWDAWQLATATLGTYILECRLRRADGAYRWWLMRGVPQRDASGTVLKWVGTYTDIHDMKLAELEISRANRELQQQQTELRVLFDLMPALILFKDTENRILRINRHGAEAAGRSVEQIEGRLATEIYPDTGAQGHMADLEVIRSGMPQLGTVARIRDVHGKEMWVQRDRVPYRDASGKVIGIVLMAQDITPRKRDQDALRELNADLESRVRHRTAELSLARSQAEEASRAKSDFLAAMSHEIRTPMSGLLGLLELLQLSTLDEGQHATLGLARESGESLLSIIDDVLDFSKIEANRLDLNLVASSVKGIVENAGRLHSQIASRKNLSLHVDVDPAISPLLALDPLRLGQILNNLLNNAIKFTDRGSVQVAVELVARRQEIEELRFVVRDTGIGMSAQQLGRLFQPFVQADAAISNRFGGTGLGLVIARRLAELMGGAVEMESEYGRGTTATLTLALEVCDAGAPAQPSIPSRRDLLGALVAERRPAPSIEEAAAEGTLLLVVDDHPTNRRVLLQQAASLGYAAEAAADGVQALALWRSGRFGAVITDCNMPRMNGYELAAEIRAIERLGGQRRVPIIACTANALKSATDMCIGAGMDDCMVKPADLARVSEMLDQWLPLARAATTGPAAIALPAANPARAATVTEGLLDTVLLAEISGGNATATAQILADFRQANELDAAALRRAAGRDDFTPVMEVSHRIKGATLMLGATRLSEACGRIEAAGAAGHPADLHVAMGSFETELLRLNSYLETLT
ncbi:MAG: sensor hybrid histidine kinase [Ramlibacter sp.]|nr:sensor hybrid histidine kinase [Ramlibacter sp.]